MPRTLTFAFDDLKATPLPTTVMFAEHDGRLSGHAKKLDRQSDGFIARALAAASFKGKRKATIEVLLPVGLSIERLIVIGVGKSADMTAKTWAEIGGVVVAQLVQRRIEAASIVADLPMVEDASRVDMVAALALGADLRGYEFAAYKSSAQNDDTRTGVLTGLTLLTSDVKASRSAFEQVDAVGAGVALARDLVNEPANRLGPVEFADRLAVLADEGLEVEIWDVARLESERMHALLAVAQGSERPARVAVMHWHGGKSKRSKPLCFIGKGVCFDTGGISMKPAAGMEDMKGDMGGAACVAGLMLALARRKAPINVVGIVGLVENMPSGTAIRPGDVIGSRAGKSIEVLNTDAEGRLVLADLLAYAEEVFDPKLMINLATLTGAIMVALGKENAGLFSNDDALADSLLKAGEATGETVWRMPLAKSYDKLIDSKIADMKNIGGRNGGAITAAQFLQRFVSDTPWAHLDIAGVAFDSPKSDINPSWGSGWGVRLLNQMIVDHHNG